MYKQIVKNPKHIFFQKLPKKLLNKQYQPRNIFCLRVYVLKHRKILAPKMYS